MPSSRADPNDLNRSGRAHQPGRNGGAGVRRLLIGAVSAAGVAFIMYTPTASALLNENAHTPPGFGKFGPALHLAIAFAATLPVGWLLLLLVRVRPAWAVAVFGPVAWLPIALLFNQPGGANLAAWQYGLEGALSYALAALVIRSLW